MTPPDVPFVLDPCPVSILTKEKHTLTMQKSLSDKGTVANTINELESSDGEERQFQTLDS